MPALVTLLHEPLLLHLWADSDVWMWSVCGLKRLLKRVFFC